MEYLTLLKANIKRQKGSYIGVLVLIFLITVCAVAIITISSNSEKYVVDETDRIGYGDFTSWVLNYEHLYEITQDVSNNENVEKVEVSRCIVINEYKVNGNENQDSLMLMPYEGNNLKYRLLNENLSGYTDTVELNSGEILVSPAITSLYNCKIGDIVEISMAGLGKEKFKIAGYFEDPIMGGAVMGMKTMFIDSDDYNRLSEKIGNGESGIYQGGMFHVYQKKDSTLSFAEFQSAVNNETLLGKYTEYSYSKSSMNNFMLVLLNIFAGFLWAFIAILLVVAVIIIGHNISVTIEQDYVNMGILKAVGFTKRHLRLLQLLQYILALIIGMAAGLPISKLIVNFVNNTMVTTTGVIVPSDIPFVKCLLVLGIIIAFFCLFILVKTVKIKNNTPLKAIRSGLDDIYFSSRVKLPVYKKGMNMWLAVRQFISGKKQYIGVVLIVTLLVFIVTLISRMDSWINSEDGLMRTFVTAPFDLTVYYYDENNKEDGEKIIEQYTKIEDKFLLGVIHLQINGLNYMCNLLTAPEYLYILEGRTCKYSNEVVITEFLSEDLGIGIGDTVMVRASDNEASYIVSGIYQCANDAGANFAMSMEGFERIYDEAENWWATYYILEDKSKVTEIIDKLYETFDKKVEAVENDWTGISLITEAMDAMGIFMYVIIAVFAVVVVGLTGSKMLFKEKKDLGIYKVLGFSVRKLRITFALRFGIASVIGSVLGLILSATVTDYLVGIILRICGISRFSSSIGLLEMLMPAVVITCMFMLFAYISSRKIKKVGMDLLNVE